MSFGAGALVDNKDGTVSYKVEEGNTLGSLAEEIAKKSGQKKEKVLDDLVRLNGIENPNVIEKNTAYKFPKYEALSDSFVSHKTASSEKKSDEKDVETNTSLRTSTKRFSATVSADPTTPAVVTSKDRSIWDDIEEQDAQKALEKEEVGDSARVFEMEDEVIELPNIGRARTILADPSKHPPEDVAKATQIFKDFELPLPDSAVAQAEALIDELHSDDESVAAFIGIDPSDLDGSAFKETAAYKILLDNLKHPHHKEFGKPLSQMDDEEKLMALALYPYLKDWRECDLSPEEYELARLLIDLFYEKDADGELKDPETLKANKERLSEIYAVTELEDPDYPGSGTLLSDSQILSFAKGERNIIEILTRDFADKDAERPGYVRDLVDQWRKPYGSLEEKAIMAYEANPEDYLDTRVKNAETELMKFEVYLGRKITAEDKLKLEQAKQDGRIDEVIKIYERNSGLPRDASLNIYTIPDNPMTDENESQILAKYTTKSGVPLSPDAKILLKHKILAAQSLESDAATGEITVENGKPAADSLRRDLRLGLAKSMDKYYSYNPGFAKDKGLDERKKKALADVNVNPETVPGWEPTTAQVAAIVEARTSGDGVGFDKIFDKTEAASDGIELEVDPEKPFDWSTFDPAAEEAREWSRFQAEEQIAREHEEKRKILWEKAKQSEDYDTYELDKARLDSGKEFEIQKRAYDLYLKSLKDKAETKK